MKLPDIVETAVLGYRDELLGERICAFIRMKNGVSKTSEEIRVQLKQSIAKYKLPDRIIFVNELPKLPNGKSNYRVLSAWLSELDHEAKAVGSSLPSHSL